MSSDEVKGQGPKCSCGALRLTVFVSHLAWTDRHYPTFRCKGASWSTSGLGMAKVCLIVIDGWGISEETKGALHLESIF